MNVTAQNQSAIPATEPVGADGNFPVELASRLAGLIVLFAVELIVISNWLDAKSLHGKSAFLDLLEKIGPYILQSLVISATVFLALAYSRAKHAIALVSSRLADVPFHWGFLAAHGAAMGAFAVLSLVLFGKLSGGFGQLSGGLADVVAAAWFAVGIAGIATAIFSFLPRIILRELLKDSGRAWIYAAAAAVATPAFVIASRQLWKPATAATFALVRIFLQPLVSGFVVDPAASIIGTQKFNVEIQSYCSGLEGMGLMLVFSTLWLAYFHKDYKLPRALLLIPISMALMFLMNAFRITALILIGNAGAPNVAVGGFHSQAGWLAFNAVALGLACVAHRVPGFSARQAVAGAGEDADIRAPEHPVTENQAIQNLAVENATGAYLTPFLAILAAAMIAGASSGRFEWAYPLRFFAAAGALIAFRKSYSNVDWRFGWAAPTIGGLVFVLWIALDRIAGIPAQSAIADGLAAWPAPARIVWLIFRVMAAVVTVPIAEELAFRGFLFRRLISADFESVSPRRWTWLAVLGSSVAFGLLHGNRWIAGTIAGILYAGAQKWRGRTGDAMAAHAITNALIAFWVLWGGHWSLW